MTSKGQQEAIVGLERASKLVTAPLLRLEHALHGFSAFVVMPLFAFSNAGVGLSGSSASSVTLAVVLGLARGQAPRDYRRRARRCQIASSPNCQRASVGRRSTDAPGWAASDSRCRCSSRRWHSKAPVCSTQPKIGILGRVTAGGYCRNDRLRLWNSHPAAERCRFAAYRPPSG